MKITRIILSAVLMIAMMLNSCGGGGKNESTITDKKNNNKVSNSSDTTSSNEVIIGKQIWMTENLNIEKFRNGDSIPQAKTNKEWELAGKKKQPAWCYYENRKIQDDPNNGDKYGKLYNWHAVNDKRGLAPIGWHIPTDDEWTTLSNNLGGYENAGIRMKRSNGWKNNGSGTDESGFNGLPAGLRGPLGDFDHIGEYASWWSSSEKDEEYAFPRTLFNNSNEVNSRVWHKNIGLSVRCIRD
jgi:uncharacterized protein (TIGR02145 family)